MSPADTARSSVPVAAAGLAAWAAARVGVARKWGGNASAVTATVAARAPLRVAVTAPVVGWAATPRPACSFSPFSTSVTRRTAADGRDGENGGDGVGEGEEVTPLFKTLLMTFANKTPSAGSDHGAAHAAEADAQRAAEAATTQDALRAAEAATTQDVSRAAESAMVTRRRPQLHAGLVRWSPSVASEAKKMLAAGNFNKSRDSLAEKPTRISAAESLVKSAELPVLTSERAMELAKLYGEINHYVPIPREIRRYMKPLPRAPEDEKHNIIRNNAGLFLARFPTYEPDWTFYRPWKNGCPPLGPDDLRKKNDLELDLKKFEGGDYSEDMEGFPEVDAKGAEILRAIGLDKQLHNINLTLNANPTLTTEKRREMKRRIFEIVGALPRTPVENKELTGPFKKVWRYWKPRHHTRMEIPYYHRVPVQVMDKIASRRRALLAAASENT